MKGWARSGALALLASIAVMSCTDAPTTEAPLAPSFGVSASPGKSGVATSNAPGQQKKNAQAEPDTSVLARLKPGRARPAEVANAVIGPEGGSVRLGDFEIVVPAGAVDKTTVFRIKTPADPNGAEYSYAEFDPSGTFLLPVTIRLPLDNTQPEPGDEEASVVWWTGTEWVPLPSRRTDDGRIEAETSHFSVYGTSFRLKGVTILGG